jgi:hypothetical protein
LGSILGPGPGLDPALKFEGNFRFKIRVAFALAACPIRACDSRTFSNIWHRCGWYPNPCPNMDPNTCPKNGSKTARISDPKSKDPGSKRP